MIVLSRPAGLVRNADICRQSCGNHLVEFLLKQDSDAVMLLLPADHLIDLRDI